LEPIFPPTHLPPKKKAFVFRLLMISAISKSWKHPI
jgi:hypothetical protein